MKRNTTIIPIVPGNYADPSVIRVGSDYYMTHTSYKYLPGLIIWHSRDLINWVPVTAALHEYVGDVWAPDFVYHDGRYYIYFPANRTNWVVTAASPYGPWSKPMDLGIKGIDPGHVVGPDGKRYLHISDGHIVELTDDGLSAAYEPRHVYEGWKYPEDWEVEAYSMEGPKLTYREGYYYLTVAIGGTAGPPTSHMAASSRSRTPWGPWEHSPYNPIVHTKSRRERWWSKGHGSLIDTPDGEWHMVYHAYENSHATLGRQTLIQAVEWTEDGWFKLQSDDCVLAGEGLDPVTSSAPFEDLFLGEGVGPRWQAFGKLPEERFRLADGGGIMAEGTLGGPRYESPLLYMAAHKGYEAIVEVSVTEAAEGRLLLYYSPEHYMGIGCSAQGIRHLRAFKTYAHAPLESSRVWLKIRNAGNIISFYYSSNGQDFRKYDKVVDASGFHHNTLGGFLSLRIGLDAVGAGNVTFHRFLYQPLTEAEAIL